MSEKRKGLGRGLGALITDGSSGDKPPEPKPAPAASGGIQTIPVGAIVKSPWQPRTEFAPDALQELIESVREHGVLQPLLVRQVGEQYELIAGERRFRASEVAGLPRVPAILLDVSDQKALEIALIENLQREDLNIIEEAEGYRALADRFGLTQEQVSERVGKPRATIANCIRLLSLPDPIKQMLTEDHLSTGHAKVLLGLDSTEDQLSFAEQCLRQGLSVRSLEKIVKKHALPPKKPRAKKPDMPNDHVRYLAGQLEKRFSTSIQVIPSNTLSNGRKTPGQITINYFSNEDLERILELMGIQEEI